MANAEQAGRDAAITMLLAGRSIPILIRDMATMQTDQNTIDRAKNAAGLRWMRDHLFEDVPIAEELIAAHLSRMGE